VLTIVATDGLIWDVIGGVEIDSGTCGIGDPAAFAHLDPSNVSLGAHDAFVHSELGSAVAVCGTGGDFSMPAEVARRDEGAAFAVRLEFVDDVAEVDGRWETVGTMGLSGRCVAGDPFASGDGSRVEFDVRPGVYRVEAYRPRGTAWDCLGLRVIGEST
jgi:hypothetical protein